MGENRIKRIEWIDFCRALAIILVILCHTSEHYYHFVLTGEAQAPSLSWLFQNTTFSMGRIGVPLFLMISGTLLLSREYKSPKQFYEKNLLPLLVTTLTWIIVNYLFQSYYESNPLNLQTFLYELFMLKKLSLSHMWYMPVILGIYLVIPFLSCLANNGYFKLKNTLIPLIVALVIYFLIPTLNLILSVNFPPFDKFTTQMDSATLGGYYVFYVIIGYILVKYKFLKI